MEKLKFKDDWRIFSVLGIYFKIIFMLFRGLPYYILFRKNKGMILLGKGVKIRNPKYIESNGTLIVEDYAEIQGISKRGIKFGKNVTIGRFAMIRPSGYYGKEIGEGLSIGDYSNIGAFNYIGCSGYIEIGSYVMISPRVSIYSENHNFSEIKIPMKNQGVSRGNTIIEDDCWIAANSIILSGVKVKSGAIIAAGSVVTKNVGTNFIVAGNPAKIIKKRG